MITGIKRNSIAATRAFKGDFAAIDVRSRGFSFIRFEFLPTCSIDISNLATEDIEVRPGDDALYIRGTVVPKEHYRATLLFEGENWGYPKYRISGNCVLIEVCGLNKFDCAQMLDYLPSTVQSMSSGESGNIRLTFCPRNVYGILESVTSAESLRNGDNARFFNRYFEWRASHSRSLKKSSCVVPSNLPENKRMLYQLRRSSEGSKIILDIVLHAAAIKSMVRYYSSDRNVLRTLHSDLIEEILNAVDDNKDLMFSRTDSIHSWEAATLCVATYRHGNVFHHEALKKWIVFEAYGGGDSEIGAHILVLSALHPEFQLLYVASVLNEIPELAAMLSEIRDIQALCKRTIASDEVENIVQRVGLQMCCEAIALPFFTDTSAYIGLCRHVPRFRELRDNMVNDGILWQDYGYKPFTTLHRHNFKCVAIWQIWRFLSSCWATPSFDSCWLQDSQSVLEYAIDFAYGKFAPGTWIRCGSEVLKEQEGGCKVTQNVTRFMGESSTFTMENRDQMYDGRYCTSRTTMSDVSVNQVALCEDARGLPYS